MFLIYTDSLFYLRHLPLSRTFFPRFIFST